jgi:hypothetical protein
LRSKAEPNKTLPGIGKRKGLSLVRVIEAIEAEEEFGGDIPADVFATASSSPEAMAEALRVACRLTKQGIRRRVEALR